ncbi:MAG: ThuA domain-containing protein, partial [Coraliomargarita sp.]
GDQDAASAIAGMLASEDAALVSASASALGKLGNAAAIPALLEARKKAVGQSQAEIETALLKIGIDAEIAADLVRNGCNGAIRAEAFRQLAAADPGRTAPVLQAVLEDSSFPGRLLILQAALGSGSRTLREAVAVRLPEADVKEQVVVVAAIGELGLSAFEAPLLALLPDAEGDLRDAIIESLGDVGGDAGFEVLFGMFQDDPKNRRLARALARVNAVEADREALAALEEGADTTARIAAIKVLELRNTNGATAQLNAIAAGSPDAGLEEAVFKALETIGDAASAQVLLDRVLRTDAQSRAAQRSLKRLSLKMGAPEFLWTEIYAPALEKAEFDDQRTMILDILDGVACGDSLGYLQPILQDRGSALRPAALRVLQRWPLQEGFAAADLWLDVIAQEAAAEEEASKAKRALSKMLAHKDHNVNLRQAELMVKIAKSALGPEDKRGLLDVYDDPVAHFYKRHRPAVKERLEELKDDPVVGERIGEILEKLEFHKVMGWKPAFNDKPVSARQSELIGEGLPTAPLAQPEEKRRLLLFSATAGFRHKSIPVGKAALTRMGEATGAYETVVSDDPANFEKEALQGFDAVLLLSPTQDFFMPNKKQREQFTDKEWDWLQRRHDQLVDNLVDFVEQGGGLVGIHAATDSCYGHKEYGKAIGGFFDGHPWMANQNVMIVVEDAQHELIRPVFEGMKDFRIRDEIYQFKPEPYSRERLRVLLHLDPERSDKPIGKPRRVDGDYPVCWVQKVGRGRVFYSSLGHNDHIYWNPLMLKHYLAGIQFACGDLDADTTPSALLAMPHVEVTGCCCR